MKSLVYKVKCAIKKISLEDETQRKTLEKSEEIIHTDYVVKEDMSEQQQSQENILGKVFPHGLSDVLTDDVEIKERVSKEQIKETAKEIIKNDICSKNSASARQSKNSQKKRLKKSNIS